MDSTQPITLTFAGGTGSVTGANFLLSSGGAFVLVDCGLIQGTREVEEANRNPFPYSPASIHTLYVTHAHMDHIGRIPKLVKEGFRGRIVSTEPTRELARVMLADAVKIIDADSRREGVLPLYDSHDVERSFEKWETAAYHEKIECPFGGSVVFKDAGHILGSSIIEFSRNGKKLVCTGDLGNSPSLFLEDTEAVEDATYMIIESVYGDRNHEPKDTRTATFRSVVEDTIQRKRTLIIPAFSIERTQNILFELNELVERGNVPPVPVYLDSPLGSKVTQIYGSYTQYFKDEARRLIQSGDDLFKFPKLTVTHSPRESGYIEEAKAPKVIIAGSGMSMGGRIINYEKRFLPDPNATILFVGYQSVGTLGRRIVDGAKKVTIGRTEVKVRAEVKNIYGYSSHKDSDHLLEFVSHSVNTLKKVYVVMGEQKSSLFLAQRIGDYIGVSAECPSLGDSVQLEM